MIGLRWRFLWPVLLVTICIVTLCVFTAVSLFRQHATIAGVFHENVTSRRAAVELEECLADLIALEHAQVETVGPLHARARAHLVAVAQAADEPEEQMLLARMSSTFEAYMNQWEALPPRQSPNHEAAVRDATRLLETQVLPPCSEFRLYNGRRLEEITVQHERVLNQLAWGMAGVGGLGAIAGIVLGFGVARAWSRSISRLQVQIRDAAGKLGPALPEIVVTEEGGLGGLHDEIDRLSERIEEMVQELHQRDLEVLRAEQLAAVGQLAAGVGHEIRNPLTSIKLLVQAAIEDPQRAALTDGDLRMIEQEVRRIEGSLQTFLDFARPPRTERKVVDLYEVVTAVAGLVRGRAEKQRVAIRLESPPGPIPILAFPGQFRQVFMNLALNALDAMPAGGVLTIRVRTCAPGRIEVEVADTGPGITPTMLPRLFTPFASSKDTGLGLGLVISQRVVEDHNGTIEAVNRPGGGASFFVRLPVYHGS